MWERSAEEEMMPVSTMFFTGGPRSTFPIMDGSHLTPTRETPLFQEEKYWESEMFLLGTSSPLKMEAGMTFYGLVITTVSNGLLKENAESMKKAMDSGHLGGRKNTTSQLKTKISLAYS